MRLRSVRTWMLMAVTFPLLAACGSSDDAREVGPQDPLWESVIERHSRGEISRREQIRIVFAHDVVDDARVGEGAGDVVSVDPAIPGGVTFASRREIVVSPDGDLDPGAQFVVTLLPGALAAIPPTLDRYQFVVRVMAQGFDVELTGLNPDPDVESSLVVRGNLVTADVDDADRVEGVVSALFRDERLPIRWEHDADGLRHRFIVSGIARGEQDEDLTLAWDGASIGVESDGERRVTVPAVGIFAVIRVDAVQDQRQYVLVQFSDPLDPVYLRDIGRRKLMMPCTGNNIFVIPIVW